jgi:WD40 repeat protein
MSTRLLLCLFMVLGALGSTPSVRLEAAGPEKIGKPALEPLNPPAAPRRFAHTDRPGQRELPCTVVAIYPFPDGKAFFAREATGTIRLWETATGKELQRLLGNPTHVPSMVVSADGRTLALGDHDAVRLYDTATHKEVRRIEAEKEGAWPVAFAEDGKTLLTRGSQGKITAWETGTGKELRKFEVTGHCAGATPDGKALVTFDRAGMIRQWDAATGKEQANFQLDMPLLQLQHKSALLGASVRPNGMFLVADLRSSPPDIRSMPPLGSQWSEIWDLKERKRVCRSETVLSYFAAPPEGAMSYSIDGTLAALPGPEGKPQLWSLTRGRLLRELPLGAGPVRVGVVGERLAISPDGRSIAQARSDGSAVVWEIATGQERRRFAAHKGAIRLLSYLPDGRTLVTVGQDGTPLLWDMTSGFGKDKLTAQALDSLWADLAGDHGSRACRAIGTLQTTPAQTLPFLEAQLAKLVVGNPERVAQRITNLNSGRFATRQDATKELEGMGVLAEAALRQALEGKPSLEKQRRLQQILSRLDDSAKATELLRLRRAVEALEAIGTPEALKALAAIVRGTKDPWGEVRGTGSRWAACDALRCAAGGTRP